MILRSLIGLGFGIVLILTLGGDVTETHHRCGHGSYDKKNPGKCPTPSPPPVSFCEAVSAPENFGKEADEFGFRSPDETLAAPDASFFMFGRPLAGRQMQHVKDKDGNDVNDIVLAVGARPATLLIYLLDPISGERITSGIPDVQIDLAANARNLAVADFNGDGIPDFVVAGFGPVEVFISSLAPITFELSYFLAHTFLDITGKVSVAATDSNVAIGVRRAGGKRKRNPGKVFVYENQAGVFSPVLELTGTREGDWFGEAVAFGDVVDNGNLDLIVGAPGVDKEETENVGEMWVFDHILGNLREGVVAEVRADQISHQKIDGGMVNEHRFGWQVAVASNQVVVASKWTSSERLAEVYSDLPAMNFVVLEPESGTDPSRQTGEPGDALGDGWASGGIDTGTIDDKVAIIIGAPNALCATSDNGSGRAYLYLQGSPAMPVVFGPPFAADDWGFGWSNDIILTNAGDAGASFVIIGEPGHNNNPAGGESNDGAVYVYKHNPPPPAL